MNKDNDKLTEDEALENHPLPDNLDERELEYHQKRCPHPIELTGYENKYLSDQEIEKYDGNKFTCPICDKEHDIAYNKYIKCRCGTEFYTILVGEEQFDMGVLQNIQHELMNNKEAAILRFDYNIAEKSIDLILMLGKGEIRRAEPCGNSSHIRIPAKDLHNEYFLLELTEG